MKKILISSCCLLIAYFSFGQWEAKKYQDFWKKGDSLYNTKDYQNSAHAYSSALILKGGNISLWERWITARSWAMAKYSDSAFYHLNIIAGSNGFSFAGFDDILADDNFIHLHRDRRWSKFKNKMLSNYKKLAVLLSARIRSGNWTNPTLDGYNAAAFWSLVNEPDSAFFYLNKIVNSETNHFTDLKKISTDKDFTTLHSDLRWQTLIEQIKKNHKPGACGHTMQAGRLNMAKFTIDPASSFIKSDAKGSYKNREDKIASFQSHAYNLLLSGNNPFQVSYNKSDLSTRYLILDLSRPVAGSGSTPLGLIKDNDAGFHIFYNFDTSKRPMLIYDFREIPVGSTVESSRTEFDIHINGVLHRLLLGFWSLGDCNEPYSYGGRTSGAGSTRAMVTRHSITSYTIVATDGSIGRLWNLQNKSKPVDLGLFETGFILHLEQ